jgi:CRISPR-associated protein Csd1
MEYQTKDKAYLLGCLFACIERMQYLALGDVNSNIANRYFAAASSTPLVIFNRLLEDLNGHYIKKAKRQRPRQAREVRDLVDEIMSLLSDGTPTSVPFPSRLTPMHQGLFMVGYHTQRHTFLSKKVPTEAVDISAETEEATELRS